MEVDKYPYLFFTVSNQFLSPIIPCLILLLMSAYLNKMTLFKVSEFSQRLVSVDCMVVF
jgi:hypothetical protein